MNDSAPKKPFYKKWWFLGGVAFVILIILVSGGGNKELASRCENVPDDVAIRISGGLKDETGTSLRNLQAVKSQEKDGWYFVSADLQGAGMESSDQIVTFATDAISGSGITLSAESLAAEFSNWPLGSSTDFDISMSNDGARESKECTETSLNE